VLKRSLRADLHDGPWRCKSIDWLVVKLVMGPLWFTPRDKWQRDHERWGPQIIIIFSEFFFGGLHVQLFPLGKAYTKHNYLASIWWNGFFYLPTEMFSMWGLVIYCWKMSWKYISNGILHTLKFSKITVAKRKRKICCRPMTLDHGGQRNLSLENKCGSFLHSFLQHKIGYSMIVTLITNAYTKYQ